MKTLDCRGQACPAPVIESKKALELAPEGIEVLLDNGAPLENVRRFARNRGYHTDEAESGGYYVLRIYPPDAQTGSLPATNASNSGGKILLVTSDQLGNGPDELGRLLMKNFIFTLLETPELPGRILFLNSGVLLATDGAETVEALQKLSEMGVEIASCGLCLDYFKKKDQLAVGNVTNMFTTAELLLGDVPIIRI